MSRPLDGRVALVAGATRGAGRGTAVALGEAGAIVYCTGRTTRDRHSEYDRPETIEETAEHVTDAGGVGIAVPVDHLDAGQVQARPAEWPAAAATGDRHAPDHQPLRTPITDPRAGRSGGRDDRRHARVQLRALPALDVLRPGQERDSPYRVRAGRGTRAARLHCGGAHAGLDALGDDARALRGHRGELARRSGNGPALRRDLGESTVRGASRCGPGGRSRRPPAQRRLVLLRWPGARLRLHRRRRLPARLLALPGRGPGRRPAGRPDRLPLRHQDCRTSSSRSEPPSTWTVRTRPTPLA